MKPPTLIHPATPNPQGAQNQNQNPRCTHLPARHILNPQPPAPSHNQPPQCPGRSTPRSPTPATPTRAPSPPRRPRHDLGGLQHHHHHRHRHRHATAAATHANAAQHVPPSGGAAVPRRRVTCCNSLRLRRRGAAKGCRLRSCGRASGRCGRTSGVRRCGMLDGRPGGNGGGGRGEGIKGGRGKVVHMMGGACRLRRWKR